MKTQKTKSTYWEKLKDPRWQKKRLEVLCANNFACEYCGDDKTELHVHHPFYKKNTDPWDYRIDELKCLCENCHNDEHYESDVFNQYFNKLKISGPGYQMMLSGFMAGHLRLAQQNSSELNVISDENFYYGLSFFFKKTINEVKNEVVDGKISFSSFRKLMKGIEL